MSERLCIDVDEEDEEDEDDDSDDVEQVEVVEEDRDLVEGTGKCAGNEGSRGPPIRK